MNNANPLVAAVIAGGSASRYGGTFKPLLQINNVSLLEHLIRALGQQADEIIINVNEPKDLLSGFHLPCISDHTAEIGVSNAGPLLGVAACLNWMQANRPKTQWLLTLPGDTLEVPNDFVDRMLRSAERGQVCYATCAGRDHYLAALWHTELLAPLRDFLIHGHRAVKQFHRQMGATAVEFGRPAHPHREYFFNINTPEDYERATIHYSD